MKGIIAIVLSIVMLSVFVYSLSAESSTDDLYAQHISLKQKGVTCEVICNAEACPAAPDGWTLSETVGQSGGYHSSTDYAAGRCTKGIYQAPPGNHYLEEGEERMCCYFQD